MFPSGRCVLVDSPDEVLQVLVPESESRYEARILDVVTVKICCDDWDSRARVPLPRLHLIAKDSNVSKRVSEIGQKPKPGIPVPIFKENNENGRKIRSLKSIYDSTLELSTPPLLLDAPFRDRKKESAESNGTITLPGRIVFGGFRNPDTKAAQQEASILEATESAQKRRNQAMANSARSSEYDTSRQIERDATARMQRLAAVKRNTRKSKGK